MFKIDKEKYLAIARTEGPQSAITALHKDTNLLEIEAFEGTEGYQPELWMDIHAVREFSRQLWDLAISLEPA